jgi:hypothetical protein
VSDNGALIEGLGSPPIRVETGTPEEDGRLVLVNGKLVAVVVHLSDDHLMPDLQGKWSVEAGFGPLLEKYRVFPTFEAVEAWVSQSFEDLAQHRSGWASLGNHTQH